MVLLGVLVHIKGGNWLPAVNKYDLNDHDYGYAGNGGVINSVGNDATIIKILRRI